MFRAHDPNSGRLVALKVFEVELAPESATALATELKRLVERGLTHSAITAPVGAGLKGALPYLASEYVAGESLDIVAQRPRSAASGDVPWIIRRVAEAIDFGAGQGAEHGLLHPRDVLVTDSDARVTGLGVSRALERVGVRLPVRGPYSAPERVEGSTWNSAADIYTLAVLAYELLLNKRFPGQAEGLTIHPEELPGIDVGAVSDVLSRSLWREPDRRHRTGKAFVRDLDAALSGTGKPVASLPLLDSLETAPAEVRSWIHPIPVPTSAVDAPPGVEPPPLQEVAEIPLTDFEEERGVTQSPAGMFGSGPDPDVSAVSARKRGLGLVLGAVLVAAAAVLGYVVVDRWNTEQPPTSTPFTETTVAPPAASQSSPAATPSATSPSTPSTPQSQPKPEPSAASPSASASPAKAKPPTSSGAAPPVIPPKRAAVEAKAPAAALSGRMLIRSTPSGAQVAVNGVARGVTPLVLRNLPLGSYTIRVTMPGFAASDHQLVLAPDRESQSLEVAMQEGAGPAAPETRGAPSSLAQFGALVVESRPAGASVYFNGKLMGQTPLSVADLPVGSGTVRLELAGYRSWSSPVQVSPGSRARVAASLERVTSQ